MPLAEITTAISSIKTATTIVKNIAAIYKDTAIKEQASKLLDIIISLQSNMLSMQADYEKIVESKKEIEQRLKNKINWDAEKINYDLTQLTTGSIVRTPIKNIQSVEPFYWLCANCFENGIKSFIQPSHSMGHTHTFKCSKCNSEIKAFPEDVKSLKKWKQ